MLATLSLVSMLFVAAAPPSENLADLLLPLLTLTPRDLLVLPSDHGSGELTAIAEKRNAAFAKAKTEIAAVTRALAAAGNAEQAAEQQSIRKELLRLAGAPLDQARDALLDALNLERQRLELLAKGASSTGTVPLTKPELDTDTIARARAAATSPAADQIARQRVAAYRNMSRGIADFLAGDTTGAAAKLEAATLTATDLEIAHVYFGSVCAMAGRLQQASLAWRRALEINPDNQDVAAALRSVVP